MAAEVSGCGLEEADATAILVDNPEAEPILEGTSKQTLF